MNVVARTLAAAAVGALLVPAATAQDRDWWRETAARDAQRVRDAQSAELIRAQYERRRAAAHARLRSDQSSTLYASTLSPADVQLSCPVEPAPGMGNVIELVIDGRQDNPVSIAGGVPGRPGLAAPFDWPGIFSPVVPQAGPGWDFDTVHGAHPVSENRVATSSADTAAAHGLPFLPSASDAHGRQGIAHVLNRSADAGEVRIVAVDDSGRRYGPLRFFLEANETVQVSSDDLENGNAAKGLLGATGPGVGDWRLELYSDLDVEALSYVRASDGLVTAMHDVAPSEGTGHRVPFFHPASDYEQASRLRLINPGHAPAEVAITGIDSRGETPGDGVALTLPAGASLTYTAAELESGGAAGLRGSLGDGAGEWRLVVESEQPLQAMSLVSSPTGHLTNLSTAPSSEARVDAHQVPLFPATSDPLGRQGLVRVVNRTDTAGQLRVKAHDDTQWDYAPLVLPIGAGETVHFDSNDLEQGNPGKGFSGGTGSGQGDWRLELSSDVDIEVLSYVRAWDGLLMPMHDVVPSEAEGTLHRVAMFDPEGSPEQERVLRLINPGSESAEVAITGMDALGRSLGDGVAVTLPAGASRTYTAEQLQTGEGIGLRGSLGDGTGEWRLTVESHQPLQVMSLLSAPTGHLSNLSTAPVLVPKTLPPVFATDTETRGEETAEDVFRTEVSPIVQAQCVVCHRSGGFPADVPNSRLQFNLATVEGHVALNLAVIEAFLAVLGDDEDIEDPVTYILNKVQGVGHGGGLQLTAGTDNYASLERFLGLLGEAVAPVGITPETLFEGVTMESLRSTLRRAAIVFAGRVPTDAEYAAIEGAGDEEASEEALRAAIRGLMTGPEFHEFLIQASNDRLLTDRDDIQGVGVIDPIFGYFVDYNNLNHEKRVAGDPNHNQWRGEVEYGIRRAPLELIAHVVENDLPYTEILTADYIMANPMADEAYGGTAEFDDPSDVREFRPSEIASYYRTDDSKEQEYTIQFGNYVSEPGNLSTVYPHAGILNTTVFLKRYPTTATNRNRARSRWTYYHFLGVDIEKSAPRTTDPVALADTNNPTLNNPACTVCHTVMDPVAGAFQNYDDTGYYRSAWGGMDSLDELYKSAGPAGAEEFEITGRSEQDRQVISVLAHLQEGSNNLGFQNVNQSESCCTNILIDSFAIRSNSGDLIAQYEMEHIADWNDAECGNRWDDVGVDVFCRVVVSVEIPAAAEYQIDISVWIGYQSDEAQEDTGELRVWVPMPDDFYRDGDTWYRDMRAPGFDGTVPPDTSASLQWLAEQIVADPRFASATVKFWWPAIMGNEVAEPPEEGDVNFDGRLLASNSQAAEVTRLAAGFRGGFGDGEAYDLKDLLTEIVLSRWFRASSTTDVDLVRAEALSVAGGKRLLGPEELARKTLAVTGFGWQRRRPSYPRWNDGLFERSDWADRDSYGLIYGGIDSGGIAERARDITPVMGGVAKLHGAAIACPVAMKDFYLVDDGARQLFGGVNRNVSPAYEFGSVLDVEAESREYKGVYSVQGTLQEGRANAVVSLTNELWDAEARQHLRRLNLDKIVIRDDTGNAIENLEQECAWNAGDAIVFWDACPVGVPFDVPATGSYEIEVTAWAEHNENAIEIAGDEFAKLEIVVEGDTGTSVGAGAIKAKLAELYGKLLGVSAETNAPEIEAAYELFVEVWESSLDSSGPEFDMRCDWHSDQYYFDGIVEDAWLDPATGEEWDWDRHGWDRDRVQAYLDTLDLSDRQHIVRTWGAMLAYLLTDYRYLFL